MRKLFVLLAALGAVPACDIRDEPHRRAATGIEEGMTEQQAVAIAGTPSRTSQATAICEREGAVRELLYDATTVYFGGLTESLDGTVLVCLDSKGVVVSKSFIDF